MYPTVLILMSLPVGSTLRLLGYSCDAVLTWKGFDENGNAEVIEDGKTVYYSVDYITGKPWEITTPELQSATGEPRGPFTVETTYVKTDPQVYFPRLVDAALCIAASRQSDPYNAKSYFVNDKDGYVVGRRMLNAALQIAKREAERTLAIVAAGL